MVKIAAECKAIVSEKRSIVKPNKKLDSKKIAIFSRRGYQYTKRI
jgi:hypothetical protein